MLSGWLVGNSVDLQLPSSVQGLGWESSLAMVVMVKVLGNAVEPPDSLPQHSTQLYGIQRFVQLCSPVAVLSTIVGGWYDGEDGCAPARAAFTRPVSVFSNFCDMMRGPGTACAASSFKGHSGRLWRGKVRDN